MNSFLQTKEWMEFQKKLGRKVFEYNHGLVVRAVLHRLPLGKSYLYIPHGPQMGNPNSGLDQTDEFINWLREIASLENAIFAWAEPVGESGRELLIASGFTSSSMGRQPKKTLVLDLTQSEEEILAGMNQKTRYNIRIGKREGVSVEQTIDVDGFFEILKGTKERDAFGIYDLKYYKALLETLGTSCDVKAKLWRAKYNGKTVAYTLTIEHEDTLYYLHSASDHGARKVKAPNLLRWQVMLDAKKRKFNKADMWGIDEKKYPGVTAYKLGWGGKVVERPGAFEYVFSPSWMMAYKLAKHFCQMI